jgi:hypothetical protein
VPAIARRLAPVALFALLTAIMTWPQVTRLATEATDHQDVYFNMWRFGWTAHAIATSPSTVLDGNIFYPERRALTFSDAMPVESALAAPLLWAKTPPVLVHNLLLLSAIVLSGSGMFVLARRLTGSAAAGITAGFVFAFAPYRFDHYMHMELQWTVWMPWAFWALHRTLETGSLRDGMLMGAFVALQFMSSIYYGTYLAALLGLVTLLLLCTVRRPQLRSRLIAVAIAGVTAIGMSAPYALQYAITKKRLGGRPSEQVLMFSAKPTSYTVASDTNFLYSDRENPRSRPERRLFPGILPMLLALVGLLLRPPRDEAIAYLIGLAIAFEMSLGFYGYIYPVLYQHLPVFDGLRAPARLGIFVVFFLAALAAYGHAAIEKSLRGERQETPPSRIRTSVLATAICGVLMLEYWVAPLPLVRFPNAAPPVYAWLAKQPRGVVAEMPVSPPHALPGDDPRYSYLSTFHWMPLMNGYSGYYPPSYIDNVGRLQRFPDELSTRTLQGAGVRYVIVHTDSYAFIKQGPLLDALARNQAYVQLGVFPDGVGMAVVYRLRDS